MKKAFLALLLCFISLVANAQFSSPESIYGKGFTIGLEKNTSAFLEYEWQKGFFVGAKHTIIIDKVDYQSFRVEGGYNWDNKFVQMTAAPFVTSDWKGSFWNIGMNIMAISNYLSDYARIGAQYVPYYDNDLKMQHGWSVSGMVNITKEIALLAEFSRKPDYRIAYKRVYAGLSFHIKNLTVVPMVEFPIYDSEFHASHSSVVVNVAYTFVKN